jgi:hypothetical protein
MGTYVAGVVRRKNVPITIHDHQSLFDMALAPCLSGSPQHQRRLVTEALRPALYQDALCIALKLWSQRTISVPFLF